MGMCHQLNNVRQESYELELQVRPKWMKRKKHKSGKLAAKRSAATTRFWKCRRSGVRRCFQYERGWQSDFRVLFWRSTAMNIGENGGSNECDVSVPGFGTVEKLQMETLNTSSWKASSRLSVKSQSYRDISMGCIHSHFLSLSFFFLLTCLYLYL